MDFYRRNLPHWQPKGAEFFVTFRLAGSLPKEVITHLKEKYHQLKKLKKESKESELVDKFEAKIFRSFDDFLDRELTGPIWLSNKKVAKIVVDSLHFYDQTRYDLYAFTIMSNHVHFVFRHLEQYDVNLPVTSIMKNIKSYTAKEANKLLVRKGSFWQYESYDRVIRDEAELENTLKYTLYNPVKAGLINEWKQWPYTYCKPEFAEYL